MKKIILFCLTLTSTYAICQKTLTFDDMKTIKKGMFENIKCDIYIANDGHSYKIGDTLTIGRPSSNKTFAFISTGTALGGLNPLEVSASGKSTIIKEMYVNGTKKTGYNIYVKGSGYCDICGNNFIDFEQAMASGELQSLGMTKEKAISKLKEAKDLLDLGIMSKEDYEKIKNELTPIIINKQSN